MTFGGTILLYRTAFLAEMSASDYIAFHTAFGLITAAVMAMLSISAQLAALKPALEMLKPILEAEPENDGYRNQVTSLRVILMSIRSNSVIRRICHMC